MGLALVRGLGPEEVLGPGFGAGVLLAAGEGASSGGGGALAQPKSAKSESENKKERRSFTGVRAYRG